MESNKTNNHQNLSNLELIRAVLAHSELEDAWNARNPHAPSPTSTEALIASNERLLLIVDPESTIKVISKLKDMTDIETAHDLLDLGQITALEDELNYLLNCNLDDDLEKDLEKGLDVVQVIVVDVNVVAPPHRTYLFLGCLPMPLPSFVQQEVLLMVPTFFRKLMGWKNGKAAPATKPAETAGPKAKGFGGDNGQTAVTDVVDAFFGRSSNGKKDAPTTKPRTKSAGPAGPKAKGFGGDSGRTTATDVFDAFFGRSSNGKKDAPTTKPRTKPAGPAGPKAKGFGSDNGQTTVADVSDALGGRSSNGKKDAPMTKPAGPAGPKAKGFGGDNGRTTATDVFDAFFGRSSNGKKME